MKVRQYRCDVAREIRRIPRTHKTDSQSIVTGNNTPPQQIESIGRQSRMTLAALMMLLRRRSDANRDSCVMGHEPPSKEQFCWRQQGGLGNRRSLHLLSVDHVLDHSISRIPYLIAYLAQMTVPLTLFSGNFAFRNENLLNE
jgi:hypothetical protein